MSSLSKKKRLGVVIDAIHEQYQSGIWKGICHRAKEWGADVLSFAGTSQDGVDHFDAHYDIVQNFLIHTEIDAVIVFSGSIEEHHGKAFTEALCQSFGDIPITCVSEKIADYPTIMVENGPGIEQIVAHLVTRHDRRHIAFIKGPSNHAEAEARLTAYHRALERNGIPFDESLVFEGSFLARDGAMAVRTLVSSKRPCDAIVCVNDHTAIGVLDELRRQGLHVPGDISVAGFDDVKEAMTAEPALTTVRQPLFLMGVSAVDNVLYQATGKMVPSETVLPAEPVYRRSCGCFSKEVSSAKAVHVHADSVSRDDIIDRILKQVAPVIDTTSAHFLGPDAMRQSLVDFLDSLGRNVDHPTGQYGFLNALDTLLFKATAYCDSIALLMIILRELTVYVPSLFSDTVKQAEANNLLQQGKALVQEKRVHSASKGFIAEQHFQRHINVVSQRIISSFEQRELIESIARGLPALNVNSMVLAVFHRDSVNRRNWRYSDFCELKLAYNIRLNRTEYPRDNSKIPSGDIFVMDLLEPERTNNHIFMPLVHRDEYLGYVVLEYTDTAPLFMYEELRQHIGSAIKSAMLLRKFKAQSMLDELTGVYNRRGFVTLGNKMLESARATGLEMMMFYADVDGLKGINDTYGHEHGDVIISGAAQVLSETFRERDLIARIGGDEFVVVLISDTMAGLEEKIRERYEMFEARFNERLKRQYSLSLSLGVAICKTSDGENLERLMKRADADLFAKKRERKLALK
ncbi:MAG: GGDEF domain-containing protein [Deltaproteobacteria bacterium]|nr:GGDEF domain-containing protein [Deltaproteobacteria bacterium]